MIRHERLAAFPDFPGLRGNKFFRDFWFTHVGASLSCRVNSDDVSMTAAMGTKTFAWSQFDADPRREDDMGSHAHGGSQRGSGVLPHHNDLP